MFESDFMECFSHVHPVTPLVIYLPVLTCLLYVALALRGIGWPLVAAFFLGGIFIWSLVEYSMHRWVIHYEPRSTWGKRLHFMLHGVHHDYPNDATRLVMPPSVSIPLALVFYGSSFCSSAISRWRALPVFSPVIFFTTACITRPTILR